MTTRVPIRYGGTGANTAADARTALGVAPVEAYGVANSAYDQANAAYAQANAAYDAANNAQVTVYANNASNVTTQNVNFVNTATVTVTVTADGSNANIEFTAAPQTVVNDTYTAAGNTAAAATANIANGLYAISTSAYDQANAAYADSNTRVLRAGDTMTGNLTVNAFINTNTVFVNKKTTLQAPSTVNFNGERVRLYDFNEAGHPNYALGVEANFIWAGTDENAGQTGFKWYGNTTQSGVLYSNGSFEVSNTVQGKVVRATSTGTAIDASQGNILTNQVTGTKFNFLAGANTISVDASGALATYTLTLPKTSGVAGQVLETDGSGITTWSSNVYTLSNTIYAQANAAYNQANAAYAEANLKLNLTGGTITGALNVSGNLTITGNTNYINVSTLNVSDPLIYLAANNDTSDLVDIGFMGGHNTAGVYQHSGLARHAGDGKFYLFTGLAEEGHENNVIDVANTTLATLKANLEANSILLVGNTVATEANLNLAFNQANTARDTANSAYGQANDAYSQANASYGQANDAYGQANTAYGQANAAYDQANSAYSAANNAANTVSISQNGTGTLYNKSLNFVNTNSVLVSISADGSNANIALTSLLTVPGTNNIIQSITYNAPNSDANLVYTLPTTVYSQDYVFVIKNGITLTPTTDYSVFGTQVTVKEAGQANDVIELRYFVDAAIVGPENTVIYVESNTLSTNANTFYLAYNIAGENYVSVSKNGLVLTPNTHYNLVNGNTVILSTEGLVNDTITFTYFFDLQNVTDGNVLTVATQAYAQANAAYNAANNRVLKAGDTMTGNLNVAATLITQNVIPDANVTYDLGTSTRRFKDLWLSNSTIYLGEAIITANGGNVSFNNSTVQLSNVTSKFNVINDMYVSGNVGIGNTSPGSKLTVAGTIESTTDGFKFPDGTTQTTAAASVTGIPTLNIVTGTAVTAVVSNHYALTNTAQTSVTLPASPSSGDLVWVTVENGLANNVILTNGNKIKGLSDNLVIDVANVGIQLRYVNANVGWTIN